LDVFFVFVLSPRPAVKHQLTNLTATNTVTVQIPATSLSNATLGQLFAHRPLSLTKQYN